jgi:exopolysaccharide biosynthesis polyprenyl glycosylphosphotransferase
MTIGSNQQRISSQVTGTQPPAILNGLSWIEKYLPVEWVVLPLFLIDAFCIVLSLTGAHYLRFDLLEYYGLYARSYYMRLAWIAVPMCLIMFALYRMYDANRLFGGLQEYASALNACTMSLVGLIVYTFLIRETAIEMSRGWWAMLWMFSVSSVILARFGYRRFVYYLRRRGVCTRRALILGTNREAQVIADQLNASPTAGVELIGFIKPTSSQEVAVNGIPILSGLHNLRSLVHSLGVEELIVVPTALSRENLLDVYRDWGTQGEVRLRLSSGLYELFTTSVEVNDVGFIPLLSINRTRITGVDAVLKALLDYIGALLGLILLTPVFAFIAILVKLDSSGPVFYRRRVIGLHRKAFDAYKFRTMIVDADAYLENHPHLKGEWEAKGKIQDDPRVTRVGRWLRKYSLDELPQLFNVLRGEMSLVGPRMITAEELQHFGEWKHNLMIVKPGLTGLWQVSGRANLSYKERVQLDMRYIRNYTIWLDFNLLFNTIWAVAKGRGAY